jgi:hypothetical protein
MTTLDNIYIYIHTAAWENLFFFAMCTNAVFLGGKQETPGNNTCRPGLIVNPGNE